MTKKRAMKKKNKAEFRKRDCDIKGKKQFRDSLIKREDIDEEKRTVSLAFSSEEPVERFFHVEILDHSSKSIRLGRLKEGGPLLVEHDRRDHVGVIESITIGHDRMGRAVVRFGKSARAEEVFQDVLDGIRKKVSVGYMVHEVILEKEKKNEPSVFRITDWEPFEISMVSIPADATVGVGREETPENIIERSKPMDEEEKKRIQAEERKRVQDEERKKKEAEEAKRKAEEEKAKIRELARAQEKDRIKEINAIGEKLGKREEAQKAIADSTTLEAFREKMLTEVMNAKPIETDPELGLSEKETREFSFLRAARSVMEKGDMRDAPFEQEVSQACEKKFKSNRGGPGFMVPLEVLRSRPMISDDFMTRSLEQIARLGGRRDLTTDIATAGGYLVGLQNMSFVELLRNSMMVARMGAFQMDGLQGDVAIPKHTGAATGYWLNEGEAPTESQQVLGQIGMTPHTVGAYTDISRRLISQSSLDVEAFVRMDLATVLALMIDLAALTGAGANGEPRGIVNITGIGSVVGGTDGAAPTWAHVVDLETQAANANALLGTLGYLTSSKIVGKLKTTQKGTNLPFIIDERNMQDGFVTMNGYRVGVSNQIPTNIAKGSGTNLSYILFGNWADLIIGYWGVLDVLVDPYTGSNTGTIRIVNFRDVDTVLRRAASMSAMLDADPA